MSVHPKQIDCVLRLMNLFKSYKVIPFAVAVFVALTVPTLAFLVSALAEVNSSSPVPSSGKTAATTVDGLTQEIVKLEVERALLDARFTPESPIVQEIERQIQDARTRLIRAGGTNEMVNPMVADGLKVKVANLEVEVAILNARYTPDSPVIGDMERKLRALRQRYAKFQPRNSKKIVNTAVSQALRTKIAEFKAERSQLSKRYLPTSIEIMTFDSQLRSLEKRLAMYQ
ncbi:hypothetical protein NUACC21_47780 [Scytonema sp. NUACC21]